MHGCRHRRTTGRSLHRAWGSLPRRLRLRELRITVLTVGILGIAEGPIDPLGASPAPGGCDPAPGAPSPPVDGGPGAGCSTPGESEVQVVDPLIAARIDSLRRASRTFDAAWRTVLESGIATEVGSWRALRGEIPGHLRNSRDWAGLTLTWADDRGRLTRSVVVVRVEWLRELHGRYRNPESVFLEAVDDLLIHELYGHLVPVVEQRSVRNPCEDPGTGESLVDSCVGKRMRVVQGEVRTTRMAKAGEPVHPRRSSGAPTGG